LRPVQLALGSMFDVTGVAVYAAARRSMPPDQPQTPVTELFRMAAQTFEDAQDEVLGKSARRRIPAGG
jgi:hypothetical protein